MLEINPTINSLPWADKELKLRGLLVPQLGHNRTFESSLFRPQTNGLWEDCLCALDLLSWGWKQSLLDSSLLGIQPRNRLANFPSGLNLFLG